MATSAWRGVLILATIYGVASSVARGQDDGGFVGILPATTVQLPTFGISIDAEGTLDLKTVKDFDGRLLRERLAAARGAKPGELWATAKLRKISLVRLEAAVADAIAAGKRDEVLWNLAGLTRVQYIFCYPGKRGAPGDVVLAGPAEPFATDASGRSIGLVSGRPILQLEDLAVALRAYPADKDERPFLGCTIDPQPDGLARLVEFQKTVPRSVRAQERDAVARAMVQGLAKSLGEAKIRVFGVSPRTHFAQVLIEADYRMKRIGIGIEPPPIKLTTFIGAADSAQAGSLQRWWFTPDYKCVRLAEDKLAAELVGQGVQLLGEDKLIGADGTLAAAGARPNKASELFTLGFTRRYPEIAAASPIYAQLRALIDLSIIAAIVRRHNFYELSGWNARLLNDETRFAVETLPEPLQVECVVNSLWKGNRLLAPAGGGVSIRPDEALQPDNLLSDDSAAVQTQRTQVTLPTEKSRWWWD
jgi:hypothetical protein